MSVCFQWRVREVRRGRRVAAGSARGGLAEADPPGLVSEQGAFDHGQDGVLLVGVEVVEGFHAQAQGGVLGAAFGVVKHERVGADRQGQGEVAQYVQGGLVGASFIASSLPR